METVSDITANENGIFSFLWSVKCLTSLKWNFILAILFLK
jgi:hypothetical protein